ncbi:hypothetical protein CIB48_g11212 [Xylaria polymorpha]|nr:hypothetical protein CIB48_g11212 [Xylaria polymorpha]
MSSKRSNNLSSSDNFPPIPPRTSSLNAPTGYQSTKPINNDEQSANIASESPALPTSLPSEPHQHPMRVKANTAKPHGHNIHDSRATAPWAGPEDFIPRARGLQPCSSNQSPPSPVELRRPNTTSVESDNLETRIKKLSYTEEMRRRATDPNWP